MLQDQASVPPQVIDRGLLTTDLLVQVLTAKSLDCLPLYRQQDIFGRGGLAIPRSILAQWVGQCGVQLQLRVDALRNLLLERPMLHADATAVSMRVPVEGLILAIWK
jgi:transposase